MNKTLLSLALAGLALPLAAQADGWSGSGELGFAAARGNARSENLNAKLQFGQEDATWKNNFYLTALRAKGEVARLAGEETVKGYELTANRYEAGASAGYKLDERSYVLGALRYENDDFAPYAYQAVVSIGYGYTVFKTPATELAFEVGPGYKRLKPADVLGPERVDGELVRHSQPSEGEVVGRGLVAFKHAFNDSTAFIDTLLVEAGSDNTFVQNDAGLQVDMSKKFALKVGYQVRHNTDAAPGLKKTDQLLTTNLVYRFGQ
jgi:putative salt-induced outer membrane protein